MKFAKGGQEKLLNNLCREVEKVGAKWGEDVILQVYADSARWAQFTEAYLEDGYYFEQAIELAFKQAQTREERVWLEMILVGTWAYGEELRELRLPFNPALRKPSFLQKLRIVFSRHKGLVFVK